MSANELLVYLKGGKEEPVRRFHPWVFSGAIARIEGSPADGDLVRVVDKRGGFLGQGHFHDGSIAVRILSFEENQDLNKKAFWVQALQSALQVRNQLDLPSAQTNTFRLVHGEGDGLSGLIVDVYGQVAVVQCHSIGMHRQRELISEALQDVLGDVLDAVYDKSAESLPKGYAKSMENGYLWLRDSNQQPAMPVQVMENGVAFLVNWEEGQKTGFFLDQRENRALLGRLAAGKSVLNTFCYTGGFSAYAVKAGAQSVCSVDVSAKAMALTARNVELNGASVPHENITEDVLRFFKENETQYDVVVVDPPAFAKSMNKRHNAVQGYKRLNASALKQVVSGGLLFTFSCSQVIDQRLFYNTIVAAAIEAGRKVRVLHHLTQGPDHPVSLFHPEGAYLKGLVLHVE
ncbi:MAG: class I SAM-dependent rRNA methyltransferase [Saprospiraceae bacterium]